MVDKMVDFLISKKGDRASLCLFWFAIVIMIVEIVAQIQKAVG